MGPDTWADAQKVLAAFPLPVRFNSRGGQTVQPTRAEHDAAVARRVGRFCSPHFSGSGLAPP